MIVWRRVLAAVSIVGLPTIGMVGSRWQEHGFGMTLRLRLTLAIVLFIGVSSIQSPAAPPPPPLAGAPVALPTVKTLSAPGSLIYTTGNKVMALELASGSKRLLAEFPQNAFLTSPALSP